MSDTRTRAQLVAALALTAAAFGDLVKAAADQAIPVNLHTAVDHLNSFASDAAEYMGHVEGDAAAASDVGLSDRVTKIEALLVESGIMPPATAPAPAPAPAAAPAPAPAVDGASNPPL